MRRRIFLLTAAIALAAVAVQRRPLLAAVLGKAMISCILAMSLDLLVGFTGLVSLAQSAFFGLSAYTLAGLSNRPGLSTPVLTLPICVTAAAAAALILQRMTVRENLGIGSEARPWAGGREKAQAAIDEQIRRFPSLQRRLDAPAGALSGGEQQMLAIARGLLAQPRILLLDEPSMGLAPLLVRQVFETIGEIHREGTTILLLEQNARMALQAARQVHVLERGEVALQGPSAQLAADPRLQAAYLGGDVQ